MTPEDGNGHPAENGAAAKESKGTDDTMMYHGPDSSVMPSTPAAVAAAAAHGTPPAPASSPSPQEVAARLIAEQMAERYGEGTADLERALVDWSTSPCCEGGGVWVAASGEAGCTGCGATHGRLLEALGLTPGASRSEEVVESLSRDSTTTTANTDVVVVGAGAPPVATTTRRQADLIHKIDLGDLMSQPQETHRWCVDRFVRRGTITTLAGRSGSYKSLVGIGACAAIQAGRPFAGMDVEQGAPFYVDGEMGRSLMREYLEACGLGAGAFGYFDTLGLNLGSEEGCQALEARLRQEGATFVVLDSLRRLTPGRKENDSDDMAFVVGRLAMMARRLDAGVLLLHHSGWDEGRLYRGSTAIGDQSDAVFGIEAYGRDNEMRRLTCDAARGGKIRGAVPPDRGLRKALGSSGVMTAADLTSTAAGPRKSSAADDMYRHLAELYANTDEPVTRADAIRAIGKDPQNQNVRVAWRRLVDEAAIVEVGAGFLAAERVGHSASGHAPAVAA